MKDKSVLNDQINEFENKDRKQSLNKVCLLLFRHLIGRAPKKKEMSRISRLLLSNLIGPELE